MNSVLPRRLKLVIEYDGTDFSGWQVQPEQRTVQGELETAIARMLGDKVIVYGAGRTDSGVHAAGQIAHISIINGKLRCNQIRNGLNSLTGFDLYIRDLTEVDESFHARYSAISRVYRYRLIRSPNPLLRRYSWHPHHEWDDQKISEAADLLIGEHSFKSFCRPRPDETEYVCHVHKTIWHIISAGAIFEIEANRFFHQMVRGLVGALLEVGRQHISILEFNELLQNPADNAQVYFAPASGLVLERVNY